MLQLPLAIVATLVGMLSSLCMLVMLMAGLANAKPSHIQQGKWMMWGIVLVQVAAAILAVWLMVHRRHWSACIAGIVPLVVVVLLVVILVKIEW